MNIRQQKGITGSVITLDQPPQEDGLLIVSTECKYVSAIQPIGVASQWLHAANGMGWVGVPPFVSVDGAWAIRCTHGRTPPSVPLTVIEWA